MEKRVFIEINNFNANGIKIINDGMLLTSGEITNFNTMTIAWGSIGSMWHYPIFIVGVRPERYTYEFMEKYNTFTVSYFNKKHKKVLGICGTKSGRDVDKVKETGLTPIASHTIDAPGFDEAELIFECSTVFKDDMKKECSGELVKNFYKERNYHRMYIGEIKAIYGISSYIQ